MIKSKLFLAILCLESCLLLFLYLHGQNSARAIINSDFQVKKTLVARLGLTDFALWTEARYTRHPSQADFFSAFQDVPASLDHFPAGSIIAPPQLFLHNTRD